jgi:outer membrane cobalamin receptor
MRPIYPIFCLLILLWLLPAGRAWAQSTCDEAVAIPEAEELYKTGNFDEVFARLKSCAANGFSESGRTEAYRLLSMSYLAIDSLAQSQRAIGQLLTLNPRFEPTGYSYSPRYKALVAYVRANQEQVVQVTSVSKRAENILYAPATVTVLTSRDLMLRGYQSLEQVLHDLPGMDVIRGNGAVNSYFYQRGYRSTTSDRTLLLIDGVEENDLSTSSAIMNRQYALSDVERIEVIYGPASTMYGANAFSGVINVITKSFLDLPGPARQVSFNGQGRAVSLNKQYFDGVLTARTKDVAISVTARLVHDGGQDLSRYPEEVFDARQAGDYTGHLDITGDSAGIPRAQTYLQKYSLSRTSPLYTVENAPNGQATALRLTPAGEQRAAELDNKYFGNTFNGQPVQFNNETTERLYRVKVAFQGLTFSYLNWKTDEGALPWYTNRSTISTADNNRWITNDRAYSLTYTKRFSDKFQILNLTSYLVHELDGNSNLVRYRGYYNSKLSLAHLAKGTETTLTKTYYYRYSTQLRNDLRLFWSPTYNLDITNGIEVRSGTIQGDYLTAAVPLPNENAILTAAQAQAQKGGNDFQTREVGVYSQATYRPLPSLKVVGGVRVDNSRIRVNGGYGYVANPRASIIYSLKPQLVLKATYAEAFKDATFFQRYVQALDPALPPERVRNLEGGLYLQASKLATFNVTAYQSWYTAVKGLSNRRRILGVQAEGSYRTARLTAWANASFCNPLDVDLDQRISDIADFTANGGADYQLGRQWHVYASANYVSARQTGLGTSGSANPQLKFDPYCIFNANLTSPDLLVPGLGFQLSITNLLNTEYFVPGIRSATDVGEAANVYAYRLPQERRAFSLSILYHLQPAATR